MAKILFYILIAFPITIFGQNINNLTVNDIEHLIAHNWFFEKALDENDNQVDEFIRKRKNNDGSDFIYKASHPPMEIKSDFSYKWNKGDEYESGGTWRITKHLEIEFTLITAKGSKGYSMMEIAEKMLGKKLKKNKDGSYIDISKYKIIDIDNNKLILLNEDRYNMIFEKK